MGKRKTAEQIADEQRRYGIAHSARTAEEFERLALDPNQGIRAVAAGSSNVTTEILLAMLETDPRRRGVVHNAARRRLEAEGIHWDNNPRPR